MPMLAKVGQTLATGSKTATHDIPTVWANRIVEGVRCDVHFTSAAWTSAQRVQVALFPLFLNPTTGAYIAGTTMVQTKGLTAATNVATGWISTCFFPQVNYGHMPVTADGLRVRISRGSSTKGAIGYNVRLTLSTPPQA